MSDCPRCKHRNSVRIIEWPLSQDGTPTHLEIQGICIMCGYESRRFCVPASYNNKEVGQVLAYMAMSHEQQEAEEIELPSCQCGGVPQMIQVDIGYHGSPVYVDVVRCPNCQFQTCLNTSKQAAQYEWQVFMRTGFKLSPERYNKVARLETLVSLLREQVICLEEQLDLRNDWISMHRSRTKPEEKNG